MPSRLLNFFLLLLIVTGSENVWAYPSREILATGGPPLNFGVSGSTSGFLLVGDETLIFSFSDTLQLIDTATFSIAQTQPIALSSDDDTDGNIMGIAYSSSTNEIVASQDDGDILLYDLDKLSEKPVSVTLSSGATLGPVAVDSTRAIALIANNRDRTLHLVSLGSRSLSATISLSLGGISSQSFEITDAVFDSVNDKFFFTTDSGGVFVVVSNATQATLINVDTQTPVVLASVAVTPSGSALYCVDSTTPAIVKIDPASDTVLKEGTTLSLAANAQPTDIAIATVTRPVSGSGTAVYAFVAGTKGITVMNTANDEIFDLPATDDPNVAGEPIPTSVTPHLLAASSEKDGYVYMGYSTGTVGLLSANPWIVISSLSYSDGTSLAAGKTATLVFQSDTTGTYDVRVGGSIDADGTLLESGTIASTGSDISVSLSYDNNSSSFLEGNNNLFVFATDGSGNRGRKSTTIAVDTPPPNVTMRSTGFGNERVYVTFTRLTETDIDHYNVYVSTDASDVLTTTDVDATFSQPPSGTTATASVGGLANGTIYFMAMEAVDDAGNVSASRVGTLSDGSAATATPELTVGPAGLAGEAGCSLGQGDDEGNILFLLGAIVILFFIRQKTSGTFPRTASACFSSRGGSGPMVFVRGNGPSAFISIILCILFFFPSTIFAADFPLVSGSMELKTGFWMPQDGNMKTFLDPCCNLITRLQGGALFWGRYGVEGSVGFFWKSGTAFGATSALSSQDRFKLLLIPGETSFVWRADYFDWRWVVPYLKVGGDYIYFRESVGSRNTQGVKYGLHGSGGVQIRLTDLADLEIRDFCMTFEVEQRWIDNFGSTGLDLSGQLYSVGLLVSF